MNSKKYLILGWFSIFLFFALATGADQGTLTGNHLIWGSFVGICGVLIALYGRCMEAAHRRQTVRVWVHSREPRDNV